MTWVLWFFRIDVRNIPSTIGDSFTDFKAKAELNSPSSQAGAVQEGALIKNCRLSYDECVYVATQKFDWSVTLIKAEKFEEITKANEFYKTWASLQLVTRGFNLSNLSVEELEFPVVLFAVKLKGKIFEPVGQLTVVLICDKSGRLTNSSKIELSCGSTF